MTVTNTTENLAQVSGEPCVTLTCKKSSDKQAGLAVNTNGQHFFV